jgi:hypothetical protein
MSLDVRKTVSDAGYITVGLGVLAVQQLQARGRELQQRLESGSPFTQPADDARAALKERVDDATRRAQSFGETVRGRVEPLVEQLEARLGELPSPLHRAAEPLQRARKIVAA